MDERIKLYEEKMQKTVDHLVSEFATIRAGRANPHVLDKIKVDYCELIDVSFPTCNDEELFYMVYHVFENIEEDYEVVTFVGCFSTQQNAEYVVQLLKDKNKEKSLLSKQETQN